MLGWIEGVGMRYKMYGKVEVKVMSDEESGKGMGEGEGEGEGEGDEGGEGGVELDRRGGGGRRGWDRWEMLVYVIVF